LSASTFRLVNAEDTAAAFSTRFSAALASTDHSAVNSMKTRLSRFQASSTRSAEKGFHMVVAIFSPVTCLQLLARDFDIGSERLVVGIADQLVCAKL
jgi:hypothetical protein